MNSLVARIKTNLEIVQNKIQESSHSVGRDPKTVKLVVVTKGQPVEILRAALAAGIERIGENYPDEAEVKIKTLGQVNAEFHMIGHLQSRKSKLVCEHFQWMHSLDSLKLADKLNRVLIEQKKRMPVLLEFNVGSEASKYGWQADDQKLWENLIPIVEKIKSFPNLEVRGLMSMPPLGVTPEKSRVYFKKLRDLRDYFEKNIQGLLLEELSMGTSYDYPLAILEGATFIRIGEAILGQRPKK
jgi:PLP dependent protein